jgi:hypothetical protein
VRSEKAGTSGTRLACDVPAFEGPDQGFELPAAESGRLARLAGPIQVCFSGDCLNSPQGGEPISSEGPAFAPETNLVSGKSNTLPTNPNSTSDPRLRIGGLA